MIRRFRSSTKSLVFRNFSYTITLLLFYVYADDFHYLKQLSAGSEVKERVSRDEYLFEGLHIIIVVFLR